MNPAVMLLANRSLPFSLYDFHLNGVSAQELADAYALPLTWVEERLEAVRLCLKYQVTFGTPEHDGPPDGGGAAGWPVRGTRATFRCRAVQPKTIARHSEMRRAA